MSEKYGIYVVVYTYPEAVSITHEYIYLVYKVHIYMCTCEPRANIGILTTYVVLAHVINYPWFLWLSNPSAGLMPRCS